MSAIKKMEIQSINETMIVGCTTSLCLCVLWVLNRFVLFEVG